MLRLPLALLLAAVAFAGCKSPYRGGFPEQPVWPGRSQVLVIREGGALVTVKTQSSGYVVVAGSDGSQLEIPGDSTLELEVAGPGEVAVSAPADGLPGMVTFEWSPLTDQVGSHIEERVDGERSNFYTEMVAQPWIAPTESLVLEVTGTDSQVRVSTIAVPGLEIEFLDDQPETRRIETATGWILRGPLRLRLTNAGDDRKQLPVGIWAAETWNLGRKEPGIGLAPKDAE